MLMHFEQLLLIILKQNILHHTSVIGASFRPALSPLFFPSVQMLPVAISASLPFSLLGNPLASSLLSL